MPPVSLRRGRVACWITVCGPGVDQNTESTRCVCAAQRRVADGGWTSLGQQEGVTRPDSGEGDAFGIMGYFSAASSARSICSFERRWLRWIAFA